MELSILTEQHLPGADELRRLAGWNQTPDDWRMLLALEPEGCFAALEGGSVIGTVTTTTYGQALAWIGMMLVHPEQRRRGIGTRLMEHALSYLQSRGITCIRLDATPAGQPLYEKLGFVAEWRLTRFRAESVPNAQSTATRALVDADWLAVEKLDTNAFGVARGHVLRRLREFSERALVWPRAGPMLGCGMRRRGSQAAYLGPIMCADTAGSRALIGELLSTAPVFWDVPDDNPLAVALASEFGFIPVRPLTRMRRGVESVSSDPQSQLAIADPSIG